MAEMADASDLGSDGRPCGFNSHYPHHKEKSHYCGFSFCTIHFLLRFRSDFSSEEIIEESCIIKADTQKSE